jgi:hypothetical protein
MFGGFFDGISNAISGVADAVGSVADNAASSVSNVLASADKKLDLTGAAKSGISAYVASETGVPPSLVQNTLFGGNNVATQSSLNTFYRTNEIRPISAISPQSSAQIVNGSVKLGDNDTQSAPAPLMAKESNLSKFAALASIAGFLYLIFK